MYHDFEKLYLHDNYIQYQFSYSDGFKGYQRKLTKTKELCINIYIYLFTCAMLILKDICI